MNKPAYQRVTINVKQEHIDKGVRKSPCDCPIALAIKEQCRVNYCKILGVDNEFYLSSSDKYLTFQLSRQGQELAQAFDDGQLIKPRDISIYIPLGQ